MIAQIQKDDSVFFSERYINDLITFSAIELLRKENFPLFGNNSNSLVIGQPKSNKPFRIWTKDDMSDEDIAEICDFLSDRYDDQKPISFFAKPSTASAIIANFNSKNESAYSITTTHMNCLKCNKVVAPKIRNCLVSHPCPDDTEQVGECIMNYQAECYNQKVPLANAIRAAEHYVNDPELYVIKEDGKVVCMARSAKEIDTNKSIEGVYTVNEYRNKGYAGAIVAFIAGQIIGSGKTAVLQTHTSNPASNKSYQNVGFIPCGKLDEVTINA